jgi:hypothetical protein
MPRVAKVKKQRTYKLQRPLFKEEWFVGCVTIKVGDEVNVYNLFRMGNEYRIQKCGELTSYVITNVMNEDICACGCPHYTKRQDRPTSPCKHIACVRKMITDKRI